MKTYHYSFLFLSLLFLCGCGSGKQADVEYTTATYTLLDNDIMTTMPGTIWLTDEYIVWEDPFARDRFVHVHERATGKKVGSMGEVGNGPREFVTGALGSAYVDNRFFAADANGLTCGFLFPDSLKTGGEPFVPLSEEERNARPRMTEYEKEVYVARSEEGEEYFEALVRGRRSSFGDYPIPEVRKYLGGEKAYSPRRKVFAYSCYNFPYLALYKLEGDKFSRAWEWKADNLEQYYDVRDGEATFNPHIKGIRGLCMSRDYIITLQRDRSKDDTDEATVGRDASKCPRSVVLYDYEGHPVKVVDLGIPVMRIAADDRDNTLYAIGVDPDFVLVKYEL